MTENNKVVQNEEPTINNSETDEILEAIDKAYDKVNETEEKPSSEVQEVKETKEADESCETDKEDDGTSKDEENKTKPEKDEDKDEKENTSEKESVKIPHSMDKILSEKLSKIKDKEIVEATVDLYKKMESKVQKKHRDFREIVDFSSNFNKKFSQYGRGNIKDKLKYVENMLEFDVGLTNNPEDVIKVLAKKYKVKIENLVDESEEYLTDEEKRFNKGLQKIDRLQNTLEQDRRKKYQEEVLKEFEDFKNAKDGDNLKHPYVDRVKKDMLTLMSSYPNASWEDLYNKACVVNEDVSNEIEKNKIKAELEKREAERKKKIKKAEKIKKQNLTTRNLNTKPTSWEEEIRNLVNDACDAQNIR